MTDVLEMPHRIKARKEHKCDTCKKVISVGEEHEKATYKGDYIFSWRTCDRCKEYVDEAFSNKAYDFSDGLSEEDFYEYMMEEHREVAEEWWGN